MNLLRKSHNRRFERKHVLDVKMRTSQRRRVRLVKFAWITLLLSLMAVALYMAREGTSALWQWSVADNPYFTMRQLQVSTDGVLHPDQISRWAGLRPGLNLFALDLARVRRDLQLIPVIASAEVERILPDTLRIHVREREPVARVPFPARQNTGPVSAAPYTLDPAGVCLPPLAPHQCSTPQDAKWTNLPELVGLPLQELRPGYRAEDPQIALALRFIAAFHHSPMANLDFPRQIDLRQPGLLRVTTSQNSTIVFGPDNLERQLRRWRAIFDYGQRRGRQVASLDLSITNHIPLVWQTPRQAPSQDV